MTIQSSRPSSRSRKTARCSLLLVIPPIIVLAMVIADEAQAQDRDPAGRDWDVTLGAGAIITPDYEGSDDQQVLPFPYLLVKYKDILYIRGQEFGVNLLNLQPADGLAVRVGPMARFRRDRPADRNAALTGLGDVDFAIEAGGAMTVQYHNAWARVAAGKDVAGGHEGLVVEGEAGVSFDLADGLTGSVAAKTSWADRDYMSAYFGVTAAQAAASGLPAYSAGSAFKDAGAEVSLSYRISRHWIVSAVGGYSRLLHDAKDAPLVRQRGTPDQWMGGLFLAYRF